MIAKSADDCGAYAFRHGNGQPLRRPGHASLSFTGNFLNMLFKRRAS